eukprot:1106535-Amphidinium_carterae.1
MPYDRSFSVNAHVRWLENFTVYGSGQPWTDLEPMWHRDDIDEAYKAGMYSFSIWWAQRAVFLCRMFHVWTDPGGITRLYKPGKDDKRPLFLRVADEFERVSEHFKPNDEVGQIFPSATEMQALTR